MYSKVIQLYRFFFRLFSHMVLHVLSIYIPCAYRSCWLSLLYMVVCICYREGNGYPLQYSCLENPMDSGVCRLQSISLHLSPLVAISESISVLCINSFLSFFFNTKFLVWMFQPLCSWIIPLISLYLHDFQKCKLNCCFSSSEICCPICF